ncbi:MAG: metal-dependent transcriptional regulator [Sphaerochaetaceae bacterium]|nr:metal-dependent transcriptional regulator [Sphaerochaetaceae bacterium]
MEKNELTFEQLQEKFPAALNYLVTMFLLEREYGKVLNSQLAKKLNVSKPAVNQAIKRLKLLNLAQQDTYRNITLTQLGRSYGIKVLTKHYLAEYMLIKRMNYPWEKADDEAQRLQHTISDEFTEYLYEFFGKPDRCPHGNPFPGCEAEHALISAPRLDSAPLNVPLEVIRITEEGEAVQGLLKFCNMHNLYPGTKIIAREFLTDESMEVENNNFTIKIPLSTAHYLCYRVI